MIFRNRIFDNIVKKRGRKDIPMKTKNIENNRSTTPLYLGLFMGIVFSAICVVCYVISRDTLSKDKNDTSSTKKEVIVSDEAPSSEHRFSRDKARFQQVLLAGMARPDSKASEESGDPQVPNFQPDKEKKEWEKDIVELREALPGNMIVPGRRTREEEKSILETIEYHQYYYKLIQDNKETTEDLKKFYDVSVKQYQDELDLLDYCEGNLKETRELGEQPNGYCLHAEEIGIDMRRTMTLNSIENIKKDYNNGFQNVKNDKVLEEEERRQNNQQLQP